MEFTSWLLVCQLLDGELLKMKSLRLQGGDQLFRSSHISPRNYEVPVAVATHQATRSGAPDVPQDISSINEVDKLQYTSSPISWARH